MTRGTNHILTRGTLTTTDFRVRGPQAPKRTGVHPYAQRASIRTRRRKGDSRLPAAPPHDYVGPPSRFRTFNILDRADLGRLRQVDRWKAHIMSFATVYLAKLNEVCAI